HIVARLEIDLIQRSVLGSRHTLDRGVPQIHCAADLSMSGRTKTVIRRTDHDAIVQRLNLVVRIEAATLEKNHGTRERVQLTRQRQACRPGPYNADVRVEACSRL